MTCFVYEICRFWEGVETAGEFDEVGAAGRDVRWLDAWGEALRSAR